MKVLCDKCGLEMACEGVYTEGEELVFTFFCTKCKYTIQIRKEVKSREM